VHTTRRVARERVAGGDALRERTLALVATETGEAGTALGLSIVEGVATAHGWSVTVEESDAGGARFEFHGVDRA